MAAFLKLTSPAKARESFFKPTFKQDMAHAAA
jgi:hypothetical protein